jgi:acetyl esterase/lipase
MPSAQLATVLTHLRRIRDNPGNPGDLPAQRQMVRDLCKIDPVTAEVMTEIRRVDLAGLQAEWLIPRGVELDRRLLYIHGGGWTAGDLDSHRGMVSRIALAAGVPVLAIHYRLAPEHPFPAGLDDCVHAYRWLRDNGPNGPAPARATFIAGDSAGGNLTLATLLACKERDIALPNAAIPISAATDFSGQSESFKTRADVDPIIRIDAAMIYAAGLLYTQGRADPLNPLVSPLHGELAGLPPLLVQVGDVEVLLDDSTRFAAKAKAAGVDVTLEVWPDMPHVWHLFGGFLPEADQAIDRIGAFVRAH